MTGIQPHARSVLSVPGTERHKIAVAAASSADEVMLDLEDSVLPMDKDRALRIAISALNEVDFGAKVVSCRINVAGSATQEREIAELSGAAARLNSIVIPKLRDLEGLESVLRTLDATREGRANPSLSVQVLIESAAALQAAPQIAQIPAVDALIFGAVDYALDFGAFSFNRSDGGEAPESSWLHARSTIANASVAAGKTALDGAFVDISDTSGLERSARFAQRLGFHGKWCIHPSQVKVVNEIFTPTDEEVRLAHSIIDEFGDSHGAMKVEGIMVDEAVRLMAVQLLARAQHFNSSAAPLGGGK